MLCSSLIPKNWYLICRNIKEDFGGVDNSFKFQETWKEEEDYCEFEEKEKGEEEYFKFEEEESECEEEKGEE